MDLLSATDLESLARGEEEGIHVSLYLPTHRFGNAVQADQLRWKNAVSAVEATLAGRGMRRPEVERLLAPARELQQDALAWQYMSDGLAMFLAPGSQRTYRLPVGVPEVSVVGERFVVGPLLRFLSGDGRFLLLALSQRKVRLMHGSRDRIEDVELADVPTSLREVVEPHEPRSETMTRPATTGTRGGPAVFYGHGAGDEHLKKEDLQRFLRQVAGGVRELLGRTDLPMVLAGLEQNVSMYRELNTYPHVLDAAAEGNPDHLSAEQLHQAAWPIVEASLQQSRQQAVARFHQLNGTGRAATDVAAIVEAATQGRVESLVVNAEPWCWEQVATGSQTVVELGEDDAFAHCELLDRAVVETLARAGQVYLDSDALTSGDDDVAAVFRY